MSLFNLTPLTPQEAAKLGQRECGGVRKLSENGKMYTVRHRPWWEMIGKGPTDKTCGQCQHLACRVGAARHFKCGRQIITSGPGTDIRKKDAACRLFVEVDHGPSVPAKIHFRLQGEKQEPAQ